MDSTVKVWDWKRGCCLVDLETALPDGCLDCGWSPVHPGVIAVCGTDGSLQVSGMRERGCDIYIYI